MRIVRGVTDERAPSASIWSSTACVRVFVRAGDTELCQRRSYPGVVLDVLLELGDEFRSQGAAGDFRNWADIRAWAAGIADTLLS